MEIQICQISVRDLIEGCVNRLDRLGRLRGI